MTASFTVDGPPVGKGRARSRVATAKDGRQFAQHYTPAKTRNYEQVVRLEFERQCPGVRFPDDRALAMTVKIYKPIPASMTKKNRARVEAKELRPGKKPDISNIIKSIEDGLNGVAYKDDSQIVARNDEAWYDERPRVEVEISVVGYRV